MKREKLYIETKIKCSLDELWECTQNPALHEKWDLRFSEIRYIPKKNENEPQKFTYTTTIGFGIKIEGVGESVAKKVKNNGESTSVLKFASDSKLSLIKEGSGYWKYIPQADGIRFFTGYDYITRWGIIGEIIDKFIFRPLMVWGTAWSFDRLKNMIEKSYNPEQAFISYLTVILSSVTLGIIWLYQGLVPKILYADTGELEILKQSGIFSGYENIVLAIIGVLEILFGFVIIFFSSKSIHVVNIISLLILAAGALFSNPSIYTLPFNPFSLTIAMIAISFIVILNYKYIPKASHCITKQK